MSWVYSTDLLSGFSVGSFGAISRTGGRALRAVCSSRLFDACRCTQQSYALAVVLAFVSHLSQSYRSNAAARSILSATNLRKRGSACCRVHARDYVICSGRSRHSEHHGQSWWRLVHGRRVEATDGCVITSLALNAHARRSRRRTAQGLGVPHY